MLAYKDLTRRRDPETRLCLFCGVPSAKEKPRLPKRTGRELDRVRHLRSPVSPSAPIPQRCIRFHRRGEAALTISVLFVTCANCIRAISVEIQWRLVRTFVHRYGGCSHVSCEENLKAKASWKDPTGIGDRRVVVSTDKRRACGNSRNLSR